jgi:hypothetical protein
MRSLILVVSLATLAAAASAQDRGAVIVGDYASTAYVTGIGVDAPWPVAPLPGEPVYHDAVARWHDGLVWVVNRGGADNIQVLDPAQGFDTVRQFSLGLGRNLQDIAFADDGTAYVSCYDTAELLHVDPQTGQVLQVISTAAFADQDGLPETHRVLVHGARLFVSCQRLDRDSWYSPVGDSWLLVLDLATSAWIDCDPTLPGVQGVRLVGTNPATTIQEAGGALLVGCVGFYGMQDGGVDVVDPEALVSLGQEITELELGGDLVDLEATGGTRHVIVADPTWVTRVLRYAPGNGAQDVHVGTGYDHAGLAYDGDFQLFVADRGLSDPGLRVFDVASGSELTSGSVIATGLPPMLVVLPPAGVVGVGEVPAASLTVAPPWPNPANPLTQVAFRAAPGQVARLSVVDLKGRVIRRDRVAVADDGRGAWAFDGRDHDGRQVPSGVYRCVVQTDTGFAARSFTVVR